MPFRHVHLLEPVHVRLERVTVVRFERKAELELLIVHKPQRCWCRCLQQQRFKVWGLGFSRNNSVNAKTLRFSRLRFSRLRFSTLA